MNGFLFFGKPVYIATQQTFFPFWLIDAFGRSVAASQYALHHIFHLHCNSRLGD